MTTQKEPAPLEAEGAGTLAAVRSGSQDNAYLNQGRGLVDDSKLWNAGVQPVHCTLNQRGEWTPQPGTTGRAPFEFRPRPAGAVRLALRPTAGKIVLDVDCGRDGKTGDQTIRKMCARFGALPPTWRLTARGPDQASGRYLFSVPDDLVLTDVMFAAFGGSVEVVRLGHRFSWAPGDVHPSTGTPVVCYGPDNQPAELPHVDTWPAFPAAWLDYFRTFTRAHAVYDQRPGEAKPVGHGQAQGTADATWQTVLADRPKSGTLRTNIGKWVSMAGRLWVAEGMAPVAVAEKLWDQLATHPAWSSPDWDHDVTEHTIVDYMRRYVVPYPIRLTTVDLFGNEVTPDPTAAAPGAPGSADELPADVAAELRRRWVRKEVDRLTQPPRGGPESTSLTDLLAEPDDGPAWRVEGLWPAGGNVVLAAREKAGKSTLVGNVLRCLADGGQLLGDDAPAWLPGVEGPAAGFAVTTLAPGRRVVLFDAELSRRMVRTWLRDHGIRNTDQVHVVALRGRVRDFAITDPACLFAWAAHLRDLNAGVVIVDPLSPLLSDAGLDENGNGADGMGGWLAAFDALLHEAGADEGMVVHHTGHDGERTRGASRLRGWPDAEWVINVAGAKGEEPQPDARRYFRAKGRDVAVREQEIGYEPAARRWVLNGGGSRAQSTEALDAAKGRVLAYVEQHPGATANVLDAGAGSDQVWNGRARRMLADGGQLTVIEGPNRSKAYYRPGTEPGAA